MTLRFRCTAGSVGKMPGIKHRIRFAALQSAALVAVTVAACAVISAMVYGYRYSMQAMLIDGLLLFPLVATLLLAARWRWMVAGTTLALGFFGILAHAIKNDQLGVPLMAADLAPLWQLLNILPGWRWWVAWAAVILVVGFILAPLWPRKGGLRWLLPVPLIVIGWSLIGGGVARMGFADAEEPREVGGLAFLSDDIAVALQRGGGGPSHDEVVQALASLSPPRPSAQLVSRRNVYMVLLETTWDPLQLKGYQFSRDPWDARFRRLWEMGSRSHILSPSFGGATANAEFEALCGMPASSSRVLFEGGLKRPLHCLPRLLRDAGYTTMASHPYKSNFWGREAAYQHAGFEAYFPIDAYELDDMDGMFLSDYSSYRQVLDRQDSASPPLFSYVVSLSSHYPFQRNTSARPDVLTVTPADGLLGEYANALAWSTSAFMDYLEHVLSRDPTALVVAFGDHAPVLGSQPNPYVKAGLRGSDEGDDLAALSRSPLLVIDGEHGPKAMGDIPLYELPNALLSLLQPDVRLHAGIFDAVKGRPRTFLGRTLIPGDATRQDESAQWLTCHPGNESCKRSHDVLKDMRTVRRDLAEGRGHTLALIAQPVLQAVNMQISRPFPACALSVKAWGPNGAMAGQPFNPQASGNSAFWFSVDEARGELKIEVAGEVSDLLVVGKTASASFKSPAFLSQPGQYPVRAFCSDMTPWEIGQFIVTAEASKPSLAAVVSDPGDEACHIAVNDWGPKATVQGAGFNVQADGSSAFWFSLSAVTGHPVLNIGEQVVQLEVSGNRASARLPDERLLHQPGRHPLTLQCAGQPGVPIGEFIVDAAAGVVQQSAGPAADQRRCAVEVASWGPQSTTVGTPFNQQPDGSSALWLKSPQATAISSIEIGNTVALVHAGSDMVSAEFKDPGFIEKSGRYPIRAVCHDGTPSNELGQFIVTD